MHCFRLVEHVHAGKMSSIILSRLSLPRVISLLESEPSVQPHMSLSSLFGETRFVSHRGGTMDRLQGLWRYPITRVVVLAIFLPMLVLGGVISLGLHTITTAHAAGTCQLNSAKGNIQHVISIQFDNSHFTRDNPNVPSDLEQMPHLLNFIKNNGALLTNHHTPLISHTATDILTSLTGVYSDRHGVPVTHRFRYFHPNGTTNNDASFAYCADPLSAP